jgi:hypothetical protein
MSDEKLPPAGAGAPRRGLPMGKDPVPMPKGMAEEFDKMRQNLTEPGAAMRAVEAEGPQDVTAAALPESFETPLPDTLEDEVFTLPSGAEARICAGKGIHWMRAQLITRNITRNATETDEAGITLLMVITACLTKINGKQLHYKQLLYEVSLADAMALQERALRKANFTSMMPVSLPSLNSDSPPLN